MLRPRSSLSSFSLSPVRFAAFAAVMGASLVATSDAAAQQPFPPQQQAPFPQQQQQPFPQGQQQLPPQQQPYPQQQQTYPPQQGYPPQGYPQQPYPPQGYPPQPQGYPPPAYGYPPPGYAPPPAAPAAPPRNTKRDPGEMAALYVTGVAYGVGTGVWIDSLFSITDPGLFFIPPLILGAAAPIGAYVWDSQTSPARGVPSSVATGLMLGAVEGLAISGVHWQYNGNDRINEAKFRTYTTITFLGATAGGIGGYAFGEFARPEPKGLTFVASGAGWGTITGTLFGVGVSGRDWKDGAALAGLIGYNLGTVGAGFTSLAWTPSFRTQEAMWLGYALGAGVGALVFPLYLFIDGEPKRGFIAMSVGSLAGLGVATALAAGSERGAFAGSRLATTKPMFKPPFDLSVTTAPKLPRLPWTSDRAVEGTMFSATKTF